MQNKIAVGVILILGVMGISGCSLNNKPKEMTAKEKTELMEKEKMMAEKKEKDAMEAKKLGVMADKDTENVTEADKAMEEKKNKEAMMAKETAGMYKDYSPTALAEATKNGGKAVLYFWAAWCPNCKTTNTELLANLDKIPKGVTVLKVNYDTEKELKTKYGITYQHTFVQVDAQGNQITKWNGGGISELTANLK